MHHDAQKLSTTGRPRSERSSTLLVMRSLVERGQVSVCGHSTPSRKSGAIGFLCSRTALTRRPPWPALTTRQTSSASRPPTSVSAASRSTRPSRDRCSGDGLLGVSISIPSSVGATLRSAVASAHEHHHQRHAHRARDRTEQDDQRRAHPTALQDLPPSPERYRVRLNATAYARFGSLPDHATGPTPSGRSSTERHERPPSVESAIPAPAASRRFGSLGLTARP